MKNWIKKFSLFTNKFALLIVNYLPYFILFLISVITILIFIDTKYVINFIILSGFDKSSVLHVLFIFIIIFIFLIKINSNYIDKKTKAVLKISKPFNIKTCRTDIFKKILNIKNKICPDLKQTNVNFLIADINSPISLNIKGKDYLVISNNMIKLIENEILSNKEIEAILLHELFHLKLHDDVKIRFLDNKLKTIIKKLFIIYLIFIPIFIFLDLIIFKSENLLIIHIFVMLALILFTAIMFLIILILSKYIIKNIEIFVDNLVVDYQKTDEFLISGTNKLGGFQYILAYDDLK